LSVRGGIGGRGGDLAGGGGGGAGGRILLIAGNGGIVLTGTDRFDVSGGSGGPSTVDGSLGGAGVLSTDVFPPGVPAGCGEKPMPEPVPEPSTLVLITTGIAVLTAFSRRLQSTNVQYWTLS
jgi:hypothetical protein